LGRENEAEKALQGSIDIHANNPMAYDGLGDLYLVQKRYPEAVSSYRLAVLQNPDYADAHLGLGRALEMVGQLTEAEDAFQQALFHDPDNAMVLYRLGQIYLLMENPERARSYFEMGMEKAGSEGNIELESTIRSALRDLDSEE
jgi:tetratricopeptide (TPR) repeat protein